MSFKDVHIQKNAEKCDKMPNTLSFVKQQVQIKGWGPGDAQIVHDRFQVTEYRKSSSKILLNLKQFN